MIVLAGLVALPRTWIAAFGAAIVLGHNLFDGVDAESLGAWSLAWKLLHEPGVAPFGFVSYPLMPWIGVMALGYALGPWTQLDQAVRRRRCVLSGGIVLAAFLALRLTDVYGDPAPWQQHDDALRTGLAFLNLEKYPPSLLYLLVTLGPGLLLLAALERRDGWIVRRLAVYGSVPLFAYVAHLFMLHVAAGLIAWMSGHGSAVLFTAFPFFPQGWGFGLPGVYLAWVVTVLLLYPACEEFAAWKRQRDAWWASYL